MDRILIPLLLLANGIGVGVMVSTVIGLAPMTLAVPYATYVRTIQFMWRRYDPFMPIMNAVACVADLVLAAYSAGSTARVLFGSAGLVLATVMIISVLKNVPVNRYVMSLDPLLEPADWARVDPRKYWRKWNLIRTSLAVLAFITNVTAVAAQV